MKIFFNIIFLIAFSSVLFSQSSDVDSTIVYENNALKLEGNEVVNSKNSPPIDSSKIKRELNHSPKLATILSATMPGAGQIYNKKYWKAPIIWAGLGVSVYYIFFNNTKYLEYSDAYRDWIYSVRTVADPSYVPDQPNTYSYYTLESLQGVAIDDYLVNNSDYVTTFLYNNRASYKRYRDLSVIITLGVYVINILDATVDAHLFDYDVGDNLSLRIEPKLNPAFTLNPSFGLSCKLNF